MNARGVRPATLLALALVAVAAVPGTARADVAEWRGLAREIAAPWPALQRGDGGLRDYVDERYGTAYGDAFMGYALLQTGLREDDRTLIRSGLRAVTFAVRRPPRKRSPFENFAVAAAYNLARKRVPGDDHFRANRGRWARWMRAARTSKLHRGGHYGNHYLIDSLAVIELRRTGLRSRRPGTILGTGRGAAWRRARQLVNGIAPRRAAGGRAAILSDPPDQPIAYHGLSAGFYARAVHLLGRRASPRARTTMRRLARFSRLASAPDGDTAYWGRSQEYVWSPAGNAYGAEFASSLPGTSRADRRANRGVAERTLDAVRREYPVSPRGQWIVPGLADDFTRTRRVLEGYAGASSMSGIALAMINWTLDLSRDDPEPAPLPADRSLGAVLSRGAAKFAVVRRGETWFTVKMAHARRTYLRRDPRYAFGLVTAKRLRDGTWFDLVPQPPRILGRAPRTFGPVLLNGGPAFPDGTRMRVDRRGVVRVATAFRTRGGRAVRRAGFAFSPSGCGVETAFRGRRGDRYQLDTFFRAGRPRVSGSSASDGEQRVEVSPRASFDVAGRRLASARDGRLHRVRIRVRLPSSRVVRIRYCAVG